jgi:hypothetical protein
LPSSSRVKKGPGRRPPSAERRWIEELRGGGVFVRPPARWVCLALRVPNWARGYKTHRPGEVIGFVVVNADRKLALGAGRWFGPSWSSPTTRRTSPLGPGRQSPSDTAPWSGGEWRPRPHHPRGPGGLRDPPSADLAAGSTVSLATGLAHPNWQAAVGVRRSRACGQSAARRMVRCPGRGAGVRLVATTQSDRQSRRGRGHCRRWLRLLGCRQQTLDGLVAIRGWRDRAGGGRRPEANSAVPSAQLLGCG